MRLLRKSSLPLLSVALLATVPAPARADIITLSDGLSGAATVVVELNVQTNTLTFTATNTSAIVFPGSTSTITALGVDLPPAGNANPSGLNGFTGQQAPSLSSSFTFSDAVLGPVPGFGGAVLDFGFLTGASFASGDIDLGLLPGESASFTVSGAAFTGFTEAEVAGSFYANFEEETSVPAPAAPTLLALGVAAFVAARKARVRVS